MTDQLDVLEQQAVEVIANGAELAPLDDVLELQRTTARTERLRAAKDELRAAYAYAQVLTNSTSINPEFQAHVERVKRRKVNGQWKVETLPPLGEQAIYNLAVAIIYGDKLGWSPEESAMRVFSVHGKPSIEAKDAIAFITTFIELRLADGRTVPFIEGGDWIWPVEESDKRAIWKSRRNSVEVTSEWTMERAAQAKYTENDKYQTNPTEMLRWKAAMEVARIQWMDVLRGLAYSREELELESAPTVTAVRAGTPRRGVTGLQQMLAERPRPTLEQAAPDEPGAEDSAADPEQPAEVVEQTEHNAEPDPVAEAKPKPASTRQITEVKRVLAVVEKLTDTGSADALGLLSSLACREVTDIDELTSDEADMVVAEINKKKES